MQRHNHGSIALWPVISLFVGSTVLSQGGTTSRESISSTGAQSNGISLGFSISADGRFVAFDSYANNLVDGDTNAQQDVFVHDRTTGQTTRVSVSSTGEQANFGGSGPSISSDGRYVAFETFATNLVPEDTILGYTDIYVHDRSTGRTELVSWDFTGGPGEGHSHVPSISGDGRYIAFDSLAALVAGDTNGVYDVYLRDVVLGTTTLVSVDSAGNSANDDSIDAHLSADGKFLSFSSLATDLLPGDVDSVADVYVRDLTAGTTIRASVRPDGGHANDDSWLASLSGDGRFVAFSSYATNLLTGSTIPAGQVFVRDLVLSATEVVSVDSAGSQGTGESSTAADSLSADGRLVVFSSLAPGLVLGDTNGTFDVFTHDRLTGETIRASVSSTGVQGDGGSSAAGISADGRFVVMKSAARSFVPWDTNPADIFMHDRLGCSPTIATYCTASSTSIAGCVAALSGTGTPSMSDPTAFVISSGSVPGGSNFGIAYFGVRGPQASSYGSQGGVLCVRPAFHRSVPRPSGGSAGNCDGSYEFTLEDFDQQERGRDRSGGDCACRDVVPRSAECGPFQLVGWGVVSGLSLRGEC